MSRRGVPQPGATGLVSALLGVLVRHPQLLPAALRFVPPRWWRQWPPLPLPSSDYARFRMQTMYGSDRNIDPDDLIRYLEWCRRMRRERDIV